MREKRSGGSTAKSLCERAATEGRWIVATPQRNIYSRKFRRRAWKELLAHSTRNPLLTRPDWQELSPNVPKEPRWQKRARARAIWRASGNGVIPYRD